MKLELTQTVYNIPGHGTAHAGAQVEVEEPLASRMIAAGQATEVVAKEAKEAKKTRGAGSTRQSREAGPTENTEGAGPAETT